MQSMPVKTFRSSQRFPNDPQKLVDLTNQQYASYNAMYSSLKRFLTHLSLTTSSYYQFQDDMLQCLDLSWEATEKIDNTIASIMACLKECSNNLNQNLSAPIKEQLDGHKAVQSELKQWKSHSSKLNRRLKTLKSTQTKKKTEARLEKAICRAEGATTLCQEDAGELCPSLIRLNTQGIQACCKTWITLCQAFNKLNTKLPPLFTELDYQVKKLHNQAARGKLPAWMERNHSSSKLSKSTLGYLNSSSETDLGSTYRGLRASLENTRDSYYSRPGGAVSRGKLMVAEHNRRLYSNTSRTSVDHSYAAPSSVNLRSNSTGGLSQTSICRESLNLDRNKTRRERSMEEYGGLNGIYDEQKIVILPTQPIAQNNSIFQSSSRSHSPRTTYAPNGQRSPSIDNNPPMIVSARPVRRSIVYEDIATTLNHQREESPDANSQMSNETISEKQLLMDKSDINGIFI